MKILQVLATPHDFLNGCWWHRLFQPGLELRSRGHEIKSIVLGKSVGKEWLAYPDVVWFARAYKQDPMKLVNAYKKLGKKIVYEIDDNIWAIENTNPARVYKKAMSKVCDKMVRAADLVTTTTEPLKEVLIERGAKNVAVIPNALNPRLYYPPKDRVPGALRIGWSGGASHWKDLMIVLEAVKELKERYRFDFYVQGISSQPLMAEVYGYQIYLKMGLKKDLEEFFKMGVEAYPILEAMQVKHIPFYPPELHPRVLRSMNLDIAIVPLEKGKFNSSKSCIKFYEFVATGTPVIASNVEPYSGEVNYLAKNTKADWKKKIEKLILDEDFRNEIYAKQSEWVRRNRDLTKIGNLWETAFKNIWNKT